MKKIDEIYRVLIDLYGPQKCYLDHYSPLELLIATILSAQCTDARVNKVTPALFEKYRTASDYASADPAELESMIHSCGFFHAKAKNIMAACKALRKNYNGEIPSTMEELVKLPGVGRKTANVVLSDAFDVPGLPVDTHVKRIANLLGLVHSDDPSAIERILCSTLAPEKWGQFSHLLILHGRRTCRANRPDCLNCAIAGLCKHYSKKVKKCPSNTASGK